MTTATEEDARPRTRKALGKAPHPYIICRGLRGHAWESFKPIGMQRPLFGVRLSVNCTRCGTERHTLYSPHTGEQLSNHDYRYPEGYRDLPGRSAGFSLAEYRVEMLRRR